MCWSIEASAAIGVVGAVTAAVGRARGEPRAIWLTLSYFTGMEALQAVSYLVIDACGSPTNQLLTWLAYIHIAFQPIFINLISMSFIPAEVRQRIAPAVYALCIGSAAFMFLQLAPFGWMVPCNVGSVLCGSQICAVTGTWHIGWEIPYRTFSFFVGFPTYLLVGFALPVLYGSWRFTLFHFITGPLAAKLSTSDPNEWPAVWCLYSVGLILIAVLTPIRHWFFVNSWFWPASWGAGRAEKAAAGAPAS